MNFFLKHIMEGKIMGQEKEEEEPSSYCIIVRK